MTNARREPLKTILALSGELQRPGELEDLLQLIVNSTAEVLDAPRASLRLVDRTRERLIAVCRTGEPIHLDPDMEWKVGEGLMGWIVEHVLPIRSGDAEHDPRFAERADRLEPIVSFLGVPLVCGDICLGVICAVHHEPDYFTEEHEVLLTLMASMCGPHVEMRRYQHVTAIDPITNALSRRGLDVALPETRLSQSGDLPLSVVMVDIDVFQDIRRKYGNVVGDQVLKSVARTLAGNLGSGDAVVRYGGEEFLLILPGVQLAAAGQMAEEARRIIDTTGFAYRSLHIPVTASFGVVQRRPGEPRSDLIMRADRASLAAIEAGRNRVVLAE